MKNRARNSMASRRWRRAAAAPLRPELNKKNIDFVFI
jgi:hypothetical protein